MSWFQLKNKQKKINIKVEKVNQSLENVTLNKSLKKNMELMESLFSDVDTLVNRTIINKQDNKTEFYLVFTDGVTNSVMVNDYIIKPLMYSNLSDSTGSFIDYIQNHIIQVNEVKKSSDIKEIVESVTYGDSILFFANTNEVLILSTKKFETRSVNEPEGEKVLSGPREGFTESLLINLSLIRRKVRSNELKMKYYTLGKRTNTNTCICYIDGLVNKDILDELYRRLDKIDIDGVLDANYITELIKDSPWSIFRTTGYTERPDIVVGKLLEGRIAIFLDGTPVVLTVPYLFIENFQSNEDYYLSFYYSSYSRLLRLLAFFLTIGIPAFYVALASIHHEMFPTPLLINIAIERQSVPLPASVECFVMLIVFDILRETGVRMPSNTGQALSIVGALVIGQAAVEAKLIAAPMIIVVAFTGITNLLVPKLNAPIIYIRLGLLIISASFGLYGFTFGLTVMFIHLLNLRSFGIPILFGPSMSGFQDFKDMFIRASWLKMIKRPIMISTDKTRMKPIDGDSNE